jgi:hypothetical protein
MAVLLAVLPMVVIVVIHRKQGHGSRGDGKAKPEQCAPVHYPTSFAVNSD